MSATMICAGVDIKPYLEVTTTKEEKKKYHPDTGEVVGTFESLQHHYKVGNSEVPIVCEKYPETFTEVLKEFGYDMAENFRLWLLGMGFFYYEYFKNIPADSERLAINCLQYRHSGYAGWGVKGCLVHPFGILGAVYANPEGQNQTWSETVGQPGGTTDLESRMDYMQIESSDLCELREKANRLLRPIGITEESKIYLYTPGDG